jgi:hypothetical protein
MNFVILSEVEGPAFLHVQSTPTPHKRTVIPSPKGEESAFATRKTRRSRVKRDQKPVKPPNRPTPTNKRK